MVNFELVDFLDLFELIVVVLLLEHFQLFDQILAIEQLGIVVLKHLFDIIISLNDSLLNQVLELLDLLQIEILEQLLT